MYIWRYKHTENTAKMVMYISIWIALQKSETKSQFKRHLMIYSKVIVVGFYLFYSKELHL